MDLQAEMEEIRSGKYDILPGLPIQPLLSAIPLYPALKCLCTFSLTLEELKTHPKMLGTHLSTFAAQEFWVGCGISFQDIILPKHYSGFNFKISTSNYFCLFP